MGKKRIHKIQYTNERVEDKDPDLANIPDSKNRSDAKHAQEHSGNINKNENSDQPRVGFSGDPFSVHYTASCDTLASLLACLLFYSFFPSHQRLTIVPTRNHIKRRDTSHHPRKELVAVQDDASLPLRLAFDPPHTGADIRETSLPS